MTGTIFDIKEFSVFDGPGIRTTVFIKGCPLRCYWCHNPEGLNPKPQLMYKKAGCTHCGSCLKGCSHPECAGFERCIKVCPNGCLTLSGREMESGDLAATLLKNKDLLLANNGGITFSGGEPLLQSGFVFELSDKLGDLHKAIQTSGYADLSVYKTAVEKFDFIMQDIKLANEKQHIKYTGVSNKKILRNIEFLKQSRKQFVFRVPLIPGITDTEENLLEISKIAGDSPVELLKYNSLAGAKYEAVGMEYKLENCSNRNCDFTKYFNNAKMIG